MDHIDNPMSAVLPIASHPKNEFTSDDNSALDLMSPMDGSFSSSPYFPGTRRSSLTGGSLDDGSSRLSSRTSFSSLSQVQSTEEKTEIISADEIKIEGNELIDVKTNRVSTRPDPFGSYNCAFGFTGKLEEPSAIPDTKSAFLKAVQDECRAVTSIQQGLKSYVNAINSGEYHDFSKDFLEHQNNATDTTIKQLDAIRDHLVEVIDEVHDSHLDDEEVKQDLKVAYGYARPWIQRTRAILISAHVFYKINYVLGGGKSPLSGMQK